ncbi:unnamed protein product [Leptidea sinapis]|uniref:Protein quiver n=1 Tax=Leptidea sinapis TaxID=189913 RepID=A0A5E4QAD1_9NEOP|nr:unnamed protein product [Leptidea sinapis]
MGLLAVCVLAVLFSLLHEGLAINCYQCNSHNDSRCLMDKLPDSLRLPCGPKDTMCRKISQVVEVAVTSGQASVGDKKYVHA